MLTGLYFSPCPLDICKQDNMDYDQDTYLNTIGKMCDHMDMSPVCKIS